MRAWSAAGARIACVVAAIGAVHCGGDDSTIGGETDGGTDGPATDGAKPDGSVGTDGGTDATVDSGPPDTGPPDTGPPDTGADAADTGPGDAGSDSPADSGNDGGADAALPPLTCATWRFAQPITLDDQSSLDGGPLGHFGSALWVGRVGGKVRVLAQRGFDVAFRLYELDDGADAGVAL